MAALENRRRPSFIIYRTAGTLRLAGDSRTHCDLTFRTFRPVFRAALAPIFDSGGVQRSTDDVISNAG